MQRWHNPWIVCITPPPPSPLPPPPEFRSADSTHTLCLRLSTWLDDALQPEYLNNFLRAAEYGVLGLCSEGWLDFRVLWIIFNRRPRGRAAVLKIPR